MRNEIFYKGIMMMIDVNIAINDDRKNSLSAATKRRCVFELDIYIYIYPSCVFPLVADVLLARVPAQLALDVAAPDEAAVALLGDVAHARLVAPAAAE